jgi:hypothetical protein
LIIAGSPSSEEVIVRGRSISAPSADLAWCFDDPSAPPHAAFAAVSKSNGKIGYASHKLAASPRSRLRHRLL